MRWDEIDEGFVGEKRESEGFKKRRSDGFGDEKEGLSEEEEEMIE